MAYIVMARGSVENCLYSYGLCSYGLHTYGIAAGDNAFLCMTTHHDLVGLATDSSISTEVGNGSMTTGHP